MSEKIVRQIAIRVPASLNNKLEALAARECNGISAICRRLLADAIEREHAQVKAGAHA